jgi:hypothetical protein
MFVPEAPVNDIRAVTMEADVTDTLIPSLAPLAPDPVVVEANAGIWGMYAAIGGLILFAWLMAKPGR